MRTVTLNRLPNLCYVAALCALPWLVSAFLPPALDQNAPNDSVAESAPRDN